MQTETLFCAVGQHDFTRERKRGVKPKVCPDCKAAATERAAAEVQAPAVDEAEIAEWIEIHVSDGHDRTPAEAFARADYLPTTPKAFLLTNGYKREDQKVIADFVEKRDATRRTEEKREEVTA